MNCIGWMNGVHIPVSKGSEQHRKQDIQKIERQRKTGKMEKEENRKIKKENE